MTQTQIDAKQAEEYVRARWEHVWVSDFYAHQNYAVQSWSVQLPSGRWTSRVGSTETDSAMWLAAYTFTLEREEAIRLKREEIDIVSEFCQHGDECGNCHIARRILAVLEAQLAELLRGMKEKAE